VLDELKEEEIVNKVGGRFKLATLIQKRLVMLHQGAKPLLEVQGDKLAVVIQEILQDKIYLDSSGAVQTRGLTAGDAARRAMLGDISSDLGGDFGLPGQPTDRGKGATPLLKDDGWCEGVEKHPIADVIAKLPAIPDRHFDAVLLRLLRLAPSDPYILNDSVHTFLRRAHSQLSRLGRLTEPVIVAHVACLVADGEDAAARELLRRFPETDNTALGSLVDYLRFVSSEPPKLSGITEYSMLSKADMFLGACYYNEGCATAILAKQSEWTRESLEAALAADGHALNEFKVRGLQPRIAELAFRRVYGRLYGPEAEEGLRDLNLECVSRLPRWSLAEKPILPPADWAEGDGARYDVKSNVLFRSHRQRLGLRGLLVGIKGVPRECLSFPGIIFTDTSDDACSWIYVGDYQPAAQGGQAADRVLPFLFRLPDRARCGLRAANHDLALAAQLFKDPNLRRGWQLAAGVWEASERESRSEAETLLDAFIKASLRHMADTFLEHALGEALTETTFDACCRYDRKTVLSFLRLADELVSSQALPVRLPRIDRAPIHSRWITDVLYPLADNWPCIQCPRCQASPTDPGAVHLQITRMTSEGTIDGRMTCRKCGYATDKVTLLTQCHECRHYPLIIGKNPVCMCGGLVCTWRGHKQVDRCQACKKGCRQGKNLTEEHFARHSERP
jgi:DNA-directed RNA polymerase subunit omega